MTLIPAIDFGGLTNYQQKVGQKAAFVQGKDVVVCPNDDCSAVAKELHTNWVTVANKQLPHALCDDWEQVVKSVQEVLGRV